MRLLFKEAIPLCFNPHEDRLKKLNLWVENANTARNVSPPNLESFKNQYDKAEELITFYTFAPLVLTQNKEQLTNKILSLAKTSTQVKKVEQVALEKQFSPPKKYLQWLKPQCDNHPVRYVKEQAKMHKETQRLEGQTHADAYIETDKLLIFFELKFMSDISYDTTFNPIRNQLARLVDVGLEASEGTKKVLIILSTPRDLFESRSRLYYYKIKEYENPISLHEDIPWRSINEITDNLIKVAYIPLEKLISTMHKDFNYKEDSIEAMEFFKERNMIDSDISTAQ
jgi:hypothetical protein